jgi:hypothetical protein
MTNDRRHVREQQKQSLVDILSEQQEVQVCGYLNKNPELVNHLATELEE